MNDACNRNICNTKYFCYNDLLGMEYVGTYRSMEPDQDFEFRKPTLADASRIWSLVRESRVLDENSCYLYLLLCRDFAETCLVAKRDSQLAGFVTAYRPPNRSSVLFVWQIAVSESSRRQGLALRMLRALLDRFDDSIDYVEATVAPTNKPSRRLFETLAEKLDAPFSSGEGFTSAHFAAGDHEAEPLIRIGPITEGPDRSSH